MRPGWKRINVLLPEAEYSAFKAACEAHRVSMNRTIRTMIYRKVTTIGPGPDPESKRGPVLKKAKAEAEQLKRQASEGQPFIPVVLDSDSDDDDGRDWSGFLDLGRGDEDE